MQTRSFWRARDGRHLQVQLRCKAAIEAEFFLTEKVPLGERREIDKAQMDRLFDFVRVWAGQHHPRDVGLEDRDFSGRMLVHGALGEGLDQSLMSVHPHAAS